MKIRKLRNSTLVSYFEDEIRDDNYNPSSEDYNQSGYTLEELREEIFNRMIGGN